MQNIRKNLVIFQFIIWITAAIVGIEFIKTALAVLGSPLTGDAIYYFGVGRGLINGLQMWKDLFETKPPIIFWISKVSILIGGVIVYHTLIVANLVCATIFLTSYAKNKPVGVLLCLALSTYVLIKSEGQQTEAFAILPIVIGLLARGKYREIIIGTCFAFIILLKEPFALTFVIALLFLHPKVAVLKSIVLGTGIALFTLLVTGYLPDYFTLYLPEMLVGRVPTGITYHDYVKDVFISSSAPALIRGLYVRKLFDELKIFWPLGITFVYLAGVYLFDGNKKCKECIVGLLFIVCTGILMNQIFTVHQVVTILHRFPVENPFFLRKILEMTVLAGITIMAMVNTIRTSLFWRCSLLIAALYAIVLSIAIGNFYPSHFLFATPVWFALVVNFSQREHQYWIMTPLFVLVFGLPEISLPQPTGTGVQAHLVDSVLSDCFIERYMAFGIELPTTHSPYQLAYGLIRSKDQKYYEKIQLANPYFQSKLLNDWKKTKILVTTDRPNWTFPFPKLEEEFRQYFSQTPYSCAKNTLAAAEHMGLRLFFRQTTNRK